MLVKTEELEKVGLNCYVRWTSQEINKENDRKPSSYFKSEKGSRVQEGAQLSWI